MTTQQPATPSASPAVPSAPTAGRWVLELREAKSDPCRVIGGVPLALRLALDAQNGGACGVAAGTDTRVAACLVDQRLRIPVHASRLELPADARTVCVRADTLVPRGLFAALAKTETSPGHASRDLDAEPFPYSVPYGFEPIEVTDRSSARLAERRLFHSLRKTQDGWTSRWLNRYVSLAISRWLVRTPLRPNQLSVGILAVGLLGAWLAAQGTWATRVIGALLFQAQSILDGCDGEISRVSYRGSKLGEWLDTIGDDLTNYAFIAGAAWGLYREATLNSTAEHAGVYYLVVGAVGLGTGLVASGLEYRYLIRIGSGDLLRYPLSQEMGKVDGGWTTAIQPLFKRDTFVFLTLVAAVANVLGVMLTLFALGAVIVFFNVLRTERQLSREGTRP